MPSKKPGIFLLILVLLYGSQGILYQGGNLFTQIVLFVILLMSGNYLIKTFSASTPLPKFFKYWILLLSLNVIGFILTGSLSDSIHFGMFKGILITLLTFFPFYFLSQKGLIQKKQLIFFVLFYTPILMLNWRLTREANFFLYGMEEIVNNVAYTLIMLIPYLFLFDKRKYLAHAMLLLIVYFVILGSKRGAIIVGGIAVLFYLYAEIKLENRKKNISVYLIGVISLLTIIFFAYQTTLENPYLITRFEQLQEGNSSGRDIIFNTILSGVSNSKNWVNILVGYGFAGSIELTGNALAHNDWLELLSNFGLIGVSIYLLFFYHAFKYALKLKMLPQYRLMLLCILTMWLTTSFFSMGYSSNDGYLRSILLGYVLGIANQKRTISNDQVSVSQSSQSLLNRNNSTQIF